MALEGEEVEHRQIVLQWVWAKAIEMERIVQEISLPPLAIGQVNAEKLCSWTPPSPYYSSRYIDLDIKARHRITPYAPS